MEERIQMGSTSDKRMLLRQEFSQTIHLEFISEQSDHLKNLKRKGQGIDISSGGLGLSTLFPLIEGQIVRIAVPIKETKTLLPIFSEVVWATEIKGRCRAGLQFLA